MESTFTFKQVIEEENAGPGWHYQVKSPVSSFELW